jgi:hemerythrin-like domain-containing protein
VYRSSVKRDPRLQNLSAEHHRALVLARRVGAQVAAGSADLALATHVADRFARDLEPHFQVEEEVLLPALRAIGQLALVSRTESDHAFLRAEAAAARAGQIAGLGAFADRLSDHVRFEERELFPCCEIELTGGVLDEVARRSQRRREGTGNPR